MYWQVEDHSTVFLLCCKHLIYRIVIQKGKIYISAYNGAVLYDCAENVVIEQYSVPMVTAQAIYDLALKRGIHIQTYTDTHIVSCAEDKELVFYRKAIHQPFIISTDLEKELAHAPFKLLAIDIDNRKRLEELRREIEASEIAKDVTCAFSNARYLEFYHKRLEREMRCAICAMQYMSIFKIRLQRVMKRTIFLCWRPRLLVSVWQTGVRQ